MRSTALSDGAGGSRRLVALGFIAVLSQPHIVLRARAEGRERCTPRCCALLALLVSRNREAAPSVAAALPFQLVCDPPDLVLEIARVVGQDLDEVHPLGWAFGIVREELADLTPHNVVAGEGEHTRVDGFHRGCVHVHQGARVTQRGVEAVVADVDQSRVLRDGQHVQFGFGDEAERTLRPAQDGVEIKAPLAVTDVGEIVAGKGAVELGEALRDQRCVLPLDAVHQLMDGSDPVGAGLHLSQRLLVQWARGPDRTVEKHGGEREHMVACLAVEAGALAARVRVDHAADRGAVGGGELGGEEQAVRFERCVELVLDDARLHAHAAVRDVDVEDAVHVP